MARALPWCGRAPARREAGPCDARAPVAHRHHHARCPSMGLCRGARRRREAGPCDAAHQSPTGITMPVSRRLELLDAQAGVVVEDDYDSDHSDAAGGPEEPGRRGPRHPLRQLQQDLVQCPAHRLCRRAQGAGARFRRGAAQDRAVGQPDRTDDAGALPGRRQLARHVRKARGVYARRRARRWRFARPWAPRPCAAASTPFICCGGRWDARQCGRKADVGVQDVAEFARKATPAPGVVIGYSGWTRRGGGWARCWRRRCGRARAWISACQQRTRRRNDGNDGTGGGRCGLLAASIYRHACSS